VQPGGRVMAIRWKVVDDERKSIIASCNDSQVKGLSYEKGLITTTHKGTAGIFVFKTRYQAKEWAKDFWDIKILKVKTIGRKKIPKWLPSLYSRHAEHIPSFYTWLFRVRGKKRYCSYQDNFVWEVPEGTECYPAVKVLT
jgi:hypothetical protein